MTQATKLPSARTGYLHGMDVIRVLASSLVLYTHIHSWFLINNQHWWLTDWTQRNVIDTLRLNDRFALIGVVMFLVVSGVVVTYVSEKERPGQFLWRRVARLAPLLWVVTVLVWILINLGQQVGFPRDPKLGVDDLARGLVLANFFVSPRYLLVGVTWTLVIQIAFYCYVAAFMPVLRRKPWIPPLVAAPVCFIGMLTTEGNSNPVIHELATISVFLPVVCLGQLISLVHSGRIRPAGGIAIGAVHFAFLTWADRYTNLLDMGFAMVRMIFLVVLLTAVMMKAKGRIARSVVVRYWSRRTYAIYLVHLSCTFTIMNNLSPVIGVDAGVLLALVTVAVTAEILHRYVEMPAERWLRGRRSPVR